MAVLSRVSLLTVVTSVPSPSLRSWAPEGAVRHSWTPRALVCAELTRGREN